MILFIKYADILRKSVKLITISIFKFQ